MRAFEDLLKPYSLSATQYNVLRILRGHCECPTLNPHGPPGGSGGGGGGNGAGANGKAPASEGLPCKSIGEQMINRDPDITRLLDRLESRSLIVRQRDTRDRRIVSTRITPEGLKILKELDKPVVEFHKKALAHMPDNKLAQLTDLLEMARGNA
jgi:DNA-binding MarR family transcriptional regulator